MHEQPSIRSFFHLEELLQPEDLERFSKGAVGLRFLNLAFKEIWQDERAPELCEAVAKVRWGEKDCRACKIQAHPPTSVTPIEAECVAGVRKTLAAVVAAGRVIGYVSGPELPGEALYEHDQSELPETACRWLQKTASNVPPDSPTIANAVGFAARRLSRRCTLERRLRILRDTRARFVAATDPDDVLDAACQALESLFGAIDICFYVLEETGFLKLIAARGPLEDAMPPSLRPDQGHIGIVIRERHSYYQPDIDGDAHFVHPDPVNPARSAFTVPIPWGPNEAPGALQAASMATDHFPLYDRQAMQAVADMAGLAAVKLFLKAAKTVSAPNIAADTWASTTVSVMATTTDRPVEILEAKGRLYAAFAKQALRVSGARAACVGIWEGRNTAVRVAASAGDGWTDEAKTVFSQPGERNAVLYAIEYGFPFDVPDTDQELRFKAILPFTRSLYIVPFGLKGEIAGVLSLAADVTNGFPDHVKESIRHLIRQFEDVLAALDTREDELFARLSYETDLQQLAKNAVDLVRRAFRVRSVSLFVKASERDRVELCATTGPMPENYVHGYDYGDGLTGWVAQTGRSLRLHDTNDIDELDRISSGLRPQKNKRWREDIADDDVNHVFIAVPLIARTHLVGVMRLKVKEDLTDFSHEEETALLNVAARLAAAIDTVWMTEEAAAKVRELESQAELQRRLTEVDSLQGVCDVLAHEFMKSTGAIAAHLVIKDDTPGYETRLSAAAGLLTGLAFDNARSADAALGVLPCRDEPALIEDARAISEWRPILSPVTERFPGSPLAAIVSVATLPFLLDDDRIFGVLLLCWNTRQDFDSSRRHLVDLTRRAVTALRPSALRRHTEIDLDHRVDELSRLRQLGLGFAQTHDLTMLMHQVLDAAIKESHMERGAIRLLDDERSALVLKAAVHIPMEAAPQFLELNDFVKQSLKSDKCVFVPDVSRNELWRAFSGDATGTSRQVYIGEVHSILHVPIRLHGECLGLILLDSKHPVHVSQQVLEYLEILGLYAAVAIDFARMSDELKRKIELAEPLAMMGTMLHGFLHVIRNRINDLFSVLGNMQDRPLDADACAKAEEMHEQLTLLHGVCNDLAYFTRTDPVSVSERVALTDLVERTLGDFGNRLRAREIAVVKSLCDPSPVLVGNPVQIEIAFKMLVQNALEAMNPGGRLTVESNSDASGARVTFRDTGEGMDALTRSRCMQPFFTTKGDRGGTGLGLPVVFGIMTRHKGKVDVQSEAGVGTTFTLSFPTQEEPARC